MSIAALTLDNYIDSSSALMGKDNLTVDKTSKGFDSDLGNAVEKKCPYSFLAKDGIIDYKGVIFGCDYQQNAITLGNMYEKEKVLKIYLPSGGALHVNIDNLGQLSKAASMFTPEDLNAIMRAIHEYNHCTRKRHEIDELKSKPIEDTAEESETPDAEKEPETKVNSLIGQINQYKTELYHKLLNNETEVKIRIGSQEFSTKEWDKLMERVDQEQERVQEALDEREEKLAEDEYEDMIQALFEDRKELE
jgi:hypothetical protein